MPTIDLVFQSPNNITLGNLNEDLNFPTSTITSPAVEAQDSMVIDGLNANSSDNPVSSMQVGDLVFYVTPTLFGGFQTADLSQVVTIGTINSITLPSASTLGNQTVVACNISSDTPAPTQTDFIFFAKNNVVEASSLLGYFGSVKFKNNSKKKAELFSVACEISPSSK